ncbi:MAG: metal-dependent transcriptional regulator [Fastidiosipilaceae bacterium]|jgi:Mn-dependent DtxR family transcriptional regulator
MKYSKSIEMYLKTIYILEKQHGHAHVVDIAEYLDLAKPSVTKAMDRLKNEELIDKESYGHITLTAKGQQVSEAIYHRYELITLFLQQSLNLSANEASINACRMEHILTEEMVRAIERYVKEI